MKNLKRNCLLMLLIIGLFTACGRINTVQTFDNSNFFSVNKAKAKIERAIKNGAANKGWQTRKIRNGLIQANILVRSKYFVSVNIDYTSKGYTISYNKSRNLKYNPQTNEIHGSYNKWVKILQDNINFQLESLGMSNATNQSTTTTVSPTSKSYKKGGDLNLEGKIVYIKPYVRFAPNSRVAQNIKSECTLQKSLSQSIVKYAKSNGLNVVIKNNIKSNELKLDVQIEQAISSGNAAVGHNKFVTISGAIIKGNKKYYTFDAARLSGGGYFGVYRTSCSVLNRIASALGRDVANWLANPYDQAMMGDTQLIRK